MAEVVKLRGALTLDSVCRVRAEMATALDQPELVIDLAEVSEIDSTAISLLLHWQRDAAAAGRKLSLQAPPENLRTLSSLYGVEPLLPPVC
ncbi:lipid asymmetry maintenance protein MlaB [Chitinimonas sp. BJYL2]|uniref:STAS domain-containing protein n=1 Tax=Chitinimonas sp. BJYL2 TaxID=2976696 RepID=UPI0022B499BC|nr:STAS domain-containing protein [Chitinimonas sp. BJYL2]